MASSTSNLGLTKPAYSEQADVAVINTNMDLIDAESGKVRANFSSDYDDTASYAVGDWCLYNGALYRCNTAISGGETWDSSHWDAYSLGSAVSALDDQVTRDSQNRTRLPNGADILSTSILPGLYYVGNATNTPSGVSNTGYVDITKRYDSSQLRVVTFRPYNSYVQYFNALQNSATWTGWDSSALNSRTAIVDYTSSTTKVITTQYLKVYKVGDLKIINCRTSTSNNASNQNILTLPSAMAATAETFVPCVSGNGLISGQVSVKNQTVAFETLSGTGGTYFAFNVVYY